MIEKAKVACQNSGQIEQDHFGDVNKMVQLGSGSERKISDIMLSRYACYLIAQNGDPRKESIAFAQSCFALQTSRPIQKLFNLKRRQIHGVELL